MDNGGGDGEEAGDAEGLIGVSIFMLATSNSSDVIVSLQECWLCEFFRLK